MQLVEVIMNRGSSLFIYYLYYTTVQYSVQKNKNICFVGQIYKVL